MKCISFFSQGHEKFACWNFSRICKYFLTKEKFQKLCISDFIALKLISTHRVKFFDHDRTVMSCLLPTHLSQQTEVLKETSNVL